MVTATMKLKTNKQTNKQTKKNPTLAPRKKKIYEKPSVLKDRDSTL